MEKSGVISAILNVIILSIVAVFATIFYIYHERWIGFIFILLGLLHLLLLKLFGRSVKSVWPDLIFGVIDNGFLVIGTLIGAEFGGVAGAVIAGATTNAITDGFAGIFEGWSAEYLRKKKIHEKRTPLSSAVGKMAGCFLGAGVVLVITWMIF